MALCLVVCIVFLCTENIAKKRADLGDIDYSASGMKKFMEKVCHNVDGEAEIAEVKEGDYYYAGLEIKLKGKVADYAEMRFYNINSSDKVAWAEVILFEPTEHDYDCDKELILAVERTLFGETKADRYLTSYYEVYRKAFSHDLGDRVCLASYICSDDTYVVIQTRPSRTAWTIEYQIYTQEAYEYCKSKNMFRFDYVYE